ncbi:hypothetical protein [Vibrio sp. WXL210]|uniref:hypothetical protein n=1 Tax=Vibrio sp. WXL210 TaxID=3450709 RepID=UPI003EC67529
MFGLFSKTPKAPKAPKTVLTQAQFDEMFQSFAYKTAACSEYTNDTRGTLATFEAAMAEAGDDLSRLNDVQQCATISAENITKFGSEISVALQDALPVIQRMAENGEVERFKSIRDLQEVMTHHHEDLLGTAETLLDIAEKASDRMLVILGDEPEYN